MSELLRRLEELHRRGVALPPLLTREDQLRILAGEWPEAGGTRVERQGLPAKRGRGGRREDLGGLYVRSAMEANWLRFLRHLGHSWEYEPREWLLTFPVPRGTREYRPDVLCRPGLFTGAELELHELKGWNDPRSKTALRRVEQFYGDRIQVLYDPRLWDGRRVPLVFVGWREYQEATRGAAGVVPGWE